MPTWEGFVFSVGFAQAPDSVREPAQSWFVIFSLLNKIVCLRKAAKSRERGAKSERERSERAREKAEGEATRRREKGRREKCGKSGEKNRNLIKNGAQKNKKRWEWR